MNYFKAWYMIVFAVVFAIYSIWRSTQIVDASRISNGWSGNSYPRTSLQYLPRGWKEVFLSKEEYFRLWDIFVVAFHLPALSFAFLYLFFKAGALQFVPVFRTIFGVKLFRIAPKQGNKQEG